MNTGGRFGTVSGLRRLVSFAIAHDLGVFVVPGPEIARINDLDIEAAGMKFVASPRHASVLLIIGDISQSLREAAAVIYAQMMRPRVLLVLGSTTGVAKLTPLPVADITADVSQQALLKAVEEIRSIIKLSAFNSYVTDFDAPILQIRIEYTCSMHPEIAQDEPGSCPKCGMDLIQREAQADSMHAKIEHSVNHETTVEYTCPMHPEVSESEPGSCPKCGMNLELRESTTDYTCPMHPEVSESEPGSCPECGMNLELRAEKTEHEHHAMGHTASAEYTCPMHPEVSESEPGACPQCGMNLELRESTADYTCPMHPEVSESEPGSCPECGMNLELRESTADYTCPMHPEVSESEQGSCPKCGMNLELRENSESGGDHVAMDHSDMDMGFMSMIEMTKDLPRSSDELPMEWIDVPFGPFFPGLAGGLLLTLTLDGDTVAGSSVGTLVGNEPLLLQSEMNCVNFIERLASLEPLTPICYQVLACQAIENAAGNEVDPQILKARVVAMEQERIVSHLSWLILFAEQTGFKWLLKRATTLQRDFLRAGIKQIVALKTAVVELNKKLSRTLLLNFRTRDVGLLINKNDKTLLGPVARASGINNDARSTDTIYQELGFNPIIGTTGDVRARLRLRLDEISQSLALIEKMGFACNSVINVYAIKNINNASGRGVAEVETPRGMARLELVLERGQVVSAAIQTPSTQHALIIESLTDQQELGDALVTIGSLDLSPWEMRE